MVRYVKQQVLLYFSIFLNFTDILKSFLKMMIKRVCDT